MLQHSKYAYAYASAFHASILPFCTGRRPGGAAYRLTSARLAGLALPFQPDNALFQSIPNTSQLSSDGYTIEEKAHARDLLAICMATTSLVPCLRGDGLQDKRSQTLCGVSRVVVLHDDLQQRMHVHAGHMYRRGVEGHAFRLPKRCCVPLNFYCPPQNAIE